MGAMARACLLAVYFGLCVRHAFSDVGVACSELETANEIAAGHNITGKVAIVTGGDSGMGFAVAEALARQGAAVVVAGHGATKSDSAARNLSVATGADVRGSPLDLSSFASVRAFANKFLKDFGGRLHYLINDAGIDGSGRDSETDDGFEVVFQVNYLGHFLLTELLLPALRKNGPSRVVNVASEGASMACAQAGFAPSCAKDFTYIPPPVVTKPNATLYGFSKLMMIEHAAELTAREASSGVTAFSLSPGRVLTDMTKGVPEETKKICATPGYQKPCPYNAQQGAAVIAYAALGNAQPGSFYKRRAGCSAGQVVMNGFTDAMRPELYQRSRRWVGIKTSPLEESVVVV